MKPLALLLALTCLASAHPTLETRRLNKLYDKTASAPHAGASREMKVMEPRLIDGGRRLESIIIMPDGSRLRFVFELPATR